MRSTVDASYQLGQQRLKADSPGFADAIAAAHATQQRPLCLCYGAGIEMYIARLGSGYIIKRMPGTGDQHAPTCPAYELPADLSGLGQLLGTAITEDPATGETGLKLGFSMTKTGARSAMPTPGSPGDSVSSDGTKLSLRGLLHFLWDQAELTRWQPSFTGKRSWATVRQRLLQAADNKITRNGALLDRLFIPEPFSVEQRDAINARRIAQWARAMAELGKPKALMLLIAEVKEIIPARYGFKAVIKHLPDQAFAMEEKLYRRMGRRFADELALWGAAETLHMVMIATFGINPTGVASVEVLSLMPVTAQWLPVEDGFELQQVEQWVREQRNFIKVLRYNLAKDKQLATVLRIQP
ncbi:MAG: DUF1173 domain-containing protein [Paucibacter sp.]|nr:DUF1173 domain-containing protein [Roseateles sp.]